MEEAEVNTANVVVVDLAFDRGTPHYAVVWQGQLLPVRFTKAGEARRHLSGLLADVPREPEADAEPVEMEAAA